MVKGSISKIAGPVITADGMKGSQMYEVVRVGDERLIGEIIELEEDKAVIQVYEETVGMKPGGVVEGSGAALSVELGPGLLGMIYDGIQRPLEKIKEATGDFIERGVDVPSLSRTEKWSFTPLVKKGDKVESGDILGEVPETEIITHKVMVPPGISGEVKSVAKSGDYTIEETIATLKTEAGEEEISMLQKWPVRIGRPYAEKLDPTVPLLSGQRIFDTFFPLAKGGTAAIPGPFGAGKTVSQHQLAKWADADVIIYVGCGERGNEMTEVLEEFPHLEDPKTGKSLMERTVLIANTSNMPVAARDASIYTGATIAEYYRDMGYNVALMADSTSRWAEAMREISGRLEEMPGEEGYPAYLASRLAEFYERAGRVTALGGDGREGSLTMIGAVSPPGGDFSEPVTQNTLRITKVFWALDASLADRRHFPSINWLRSYSLYMDAVEPWWSEEISSMWRELRDKSMALLQKESELKEIVQLVGEDALPDRERLVLEAARMIREDFLQQNAFHEIDTYCSPKKQFEMLNLMIEFYNRADDAVSRNIPAKDITELATIGEIARLKFVPEDEFEAKLAEVKKALNEEIRSLVDKYAER
ncbi:MAG TPA: ATP synthase subunit A [Euryarchaeota archaeon]|nr:V-type ATP synthase alpha chain [archaeon BMS3Bbin16]HDH28602.1 ATP synthase subunit A [Euryarchaeota archaeon]